MELLTPSFCPPDIHAWRQWLIAHHESEWYVWLVFHKVHTETANLSWSEAVDEALCFGWIDSRRKVLDADRFQQYFSRRSPTGTWSRVNKEKIRRLTREGRMRPAGLACIARAKENGSWTLLDASEALLLPDELKKALAAHPGTEAAFRSLSKSDQKVLLHRLALVKRPATRERHVRNILERVKRLL